MNIKLFPCYFQVKKEHYRQLAAEVNYMIISLQLCSSHIEGKLIPERKNSIRNEWLGRHDDVAITTVMNGQRSADVRVRAPEYFTLKINPVLAIIPSPPKVDQYSEPLT